MNPHKHPFTPSDKPHLENSLSTESLYIMTLFGPRSHATTTSTTRSHHRHFWQRKDRDRVAGGYRK